MRVVGTLARPPDALAHSAGELRGNTGGADRVLSLEVRLLVELVDHVPVARQRQPGIVAELAGNVVTLRPSWRSSEAKE
jgi:hypothetical protein